MGLCNGKHSAPQKENGTAAPPSEKKEEVNTEDVGREEKGREKEMKKEAAVALEEKGGSKPWASPFFPFYSPSPAHSLFSKKSPSKGGGGSATTTPSRFFKRPFPPPSPAKHIRALLARRQGVKSNEAAILEDEGEAGRATGLDKSFGFSKGFTSKYELGEEVGRGHFGYTCCAISKKGELKGQSVAVKVIPKAKV